MRGISLRGAREHNLKQIDLDLPYGKLIVLTGPSGSGKTSLAVDTIFAEGQRRFVESLSVQARKFLSQRPKPAVDSLTGIGPAICIRPRAPSRNPRSTVGSLTDIADFLRLLFSRLGEPHCPSCGVTIRGWTNQQVVDALWKDHQGERFMVVAPLHHEGGRVPDTLIERARGDGFVRVRVDGEVVELEEFAARKSRSAEQIELVVDRLKVRDGAATRTGEAVELARKLSGDVVGIVCEDGSYAAFPESPKCLGCGLQVEAATPKLFSHNSPLGACPGCEGMGSVNRFELDRVVPDETLSLAEGAIAAWGTVKGAFYKERLKSLRKTGVVDVDLPLEDLGEDKRRLLLWGGEAYEGVLPALERRLREYARKRSGAGDEERVFEYLEEELRKYSALMVCEECGGARLGVSARAYRLGGRALHEVLRLELREVIAWVDGLEASTATERAMAGLLDELRQRLRFLVDVGLAYLTLSRGVATLSPGEAARVQLATQIGAGLSGVIYVLDEPSAGLHCSDTELLFRTLLALRDRGNTLLVVEHDRMFIERADHLVELGPGAGVHGGELLGEGSPPEVLGSDKSITGAHFRRRDAASGKEPKRRQGRGSLRLQGARTHNLQGDEVVFPLRSLVGVTGVSGSGKSALVMESLLPALSATLRGEAAADGMRLRVEGELKRVIAIDQRPIGRSPRSNAATFCGFFKPLRELFAGLPEARARGYRPGRFSFNVKGGRCETCEGAGVVRVPMHFLPDAFVECESCAGRRYGRDTLQIRYRGHDIASLLAMSVDQAFEVLSAVPAIARPLEALRAVGLGYLEVGRPAHQLSGGEGQRVKLARELSRGGSERTLYLLDEPSTGLHGVDVSRLVEVLNRLVDQGHSCLLIEHDLELIQQCDHLIEMGPGAGPDGGRVVIAGTPEEVAGHEASSTGRYLARI